MKAIIFAIRAAVLLAALFLSAVTASAYYDPGMQRWLNRDPLGESGFELVVKRPLPGKGFVKEEPIANFYVFGENNPVLNSDPFGLDCNYLCFRFAFGAPMYACALQNLDGCDGKCDPLIVIYFTGLGHYFHIRIYFSTPCHPHCIDRQHPPPMT
jgi:RHS repeat-associated protein